MQCSLPRLFVMGKHYTYISKGKEKREVEAANWERSEWKFLCCLLTHKVYWGTYTFSEIFTGWQYGARPQGANVLTGKMPKDLSEPNKCCNTVIHNYCAWEGGGRRDFSRQLGKQLGRLVLPTNHYYHICFNLLIKNIWHVFAKINEYLYWIFEDFQVHELKKKIKK